MNAAGGNLACYFPAYSEEPFRANSEQYSGLLSYLRTQPPRRSPFSGTDADSIRSRARAAGLSRPRSAAFATCLGTVAARILADDVCLEKVALCVCSNSATSSISFMYERTGEDESWSLVDPFWLQHSIPSAPATSMFAALKLNGSALGFPGGVAGINSALRTATQLLRTKAAASAMIVLAEQIPDFAEELSHFGFDQNAAVAGAVALTFTEQQAEQNSPALDSDTVIPAVRNPAALYSAGFERMLEIADSVGIGHRDLVS